MWLLISQYFTFLSLSHLIFLSVNCQSAVYLTCQSARCEASMCIYSWRGCKNLWKGSHRGCWVNEAHFCLLTVIVMWLVEDILNFSVNKQCCFYKQTMAHIKPCDSSCWQSDDDYSDIGSALISWLGWRSMCLDYNVFVVACALYMTSANPLLKGNCGLGPVQYIICKWISFFAKLIIDISY